MKDANVRRKFVVEVTHEKMLLSELEKAVVFARQQLLEEIKRNGYNILLLEWYVV